MIGKFRKSPIHIFALMINLNGHSNLKIHSMINNRCMILLIYGYSPINQNHRHKPPKANKREIHSFNQISVLPIR